MRIKRLFVTLCICLVWALQAKAQVEVTAQNRFVDNRREILLEFNIQPKWHIFAPYEQEFGSPLQINWNLPQGEEIIENSYSRPKRFDENGFVYDGYEDNFFYKTTIKSAGHKSNIEVNINWQACAGDECLPQSKTLTILPIESPEFTQKISEAEISFAGNDEYTINWWKAALMAFAAGLLLNLMPCVLPVLGLKIMACLKADKTSRLQEGFLYTSGIMVSMLILALILLLLRQVNPHLAWGFQMQNPWFIAIMLIIFVFLTLSAFEIVNWQSGWSAKLSNIRFHNCKAEAFGSGMLAVLVASPCTAPFMGAAVGYALMSPPQIYFPIFLSLGLGYAMPFALLTAMPETIQKVMPRPGKWMKLIKVILGIPLLLTCLWLTWLLCTQVGTKFNWYRTDWQEYTETKVEQALQNKRPVFIDFTADWCITCLVNKKTSLYSATMSNLVKQKNILLLKADMTKVNEEAAAGLKKYNRGSVPLYIYYDGKSDDYITLPPILTPQILQEYLR